MQREDRLLAVQNYQKVVAGIHAAESGCGRKRGEVRLVGVTKTIPPQTVNTVIDKGLRIIGENRVQEFLEKEGQYRLEGVSVHFIGALQRNKVKYIIDKVDMIESVDSLPLAEEISKRALAAEKVMPVLIEVNIDRQESKSGVLPEELSAFLRQIAPLKGIAVKGLMCIPDPAKTPDSFERMRLLREQAVKEKISGVLMDELSMGMSEDYMQAIRYGATLVRVGRGIFGARTYLPQQIAD